MRSASGCEQWGKGRLPQVKMDHISLEYSYNHINSLTNSVAIQISLQGGKERMKDAKEEFGRLMGPVLGFVEKSAPNQVTGVAIFTV